MISIEERLDRLFNRRQRFWYYALEGREIVRISKREWERRGATHKAIWEETTGDRVIRCFYSDSTKPKSAPYFTIVDGLKVKCVGTYDEAETTFRRFVIEARANEDKFNAILNQCGDRGVHYASNLNLDQTGIEWERMDHALMRWLSENSPDFTLIHDAYYGAVLVFETAEEAQQFRKRWVRFPAPG